MNPLLGFSFPLPPQPLRASHSLRRRHRGQWPVLCKTGFSTLVSQQNRRLGLLKPRSERKKAQSPLFWPTPTTAMESSAPGSRDKQVQLAEQVALVAARGVAAVGRQ
ncbi:uncharacterized protein LOC105788252 [Gossypium raimondii]|uniref:uncharacterized protein LOC105788252 n=1 Tax=Gossypium raimondii TaxID=29730 RepID=UPI00063AA168|nr:uncharacterized protein LOC105788252 [Gossypium raimondii]